MKLSQKTFKTKRQKTFWTCHRSDEETGERIRDEPKRQETIKAMWIDLEANFDIDTQYKVAKDMNYITRNESLEKETIMNTKKCII